MNETLSGRGSDEPRRRQGDRPEFYQSILGFTSDPGADTPVYSVVWRDNGAMDPPAGIRVFFWVKDVNTLYDEVDPSGVMVVRGQDWE